MSDQLVVPVSVAPVAVRLPGSTQENLVVTNAGTATVLLEGVANNVLTAVGSSTAVTPGIPFPPGSRLRLIKNGASVYANTTALGAVYAGAPAVPASGVNATNNSGGPVAVTINGGTVTAVTVNGVQVLAGTSLAGSVVSVDKGQTISVTYSVAPTWTWNYGTLAALQIQAGQEAT